MHDNKYADLHVHTTASDGAYSPTQVVNLAAELGFSAIGIADHDAVSGIDEAILQGEKIGLEVVPGVELSTDYKGREIHILGYCFDWHDEKLNRLIRGFRDFRVKRMERMLAVLRELGCRLDEEALMKNSEKGAVGRVHLAKAMVASGFVSDLEEAFDKYLANDKPAYMKKAKLSPKEACELIKETGGAAVLAHPCLNKKDKWIPGFIREGIDGIEAYYSGSSVEDAECYSSIARKNGLLITGGSDCHQSERKFLLGSMKLDCRYVEELKAFAESRSRAQKNCRGRHNTGRDGK